MGELGRLHDPRLTENLESANGGSQFVELVMSNWAASPEKGGESATEV